MNSSHMTYLGLIKKSLWETWCCCWLWWWWWWSYFTVYTPSTRSVKHHSKISLRRHVLHPLNKNRGSPWCISADVGYDTRGVFTDHRKAKTQARGNMKDVGGGGSRAGEGGYRYIITHISHNGKTVNPQNLAAAIQQPAAGSEVSRKERTHTK